MTEKSSDDARFLGKVTAVVTHDLQNVIAIIKETAGLMEDILLMNQGKESPFLEKFQKSLTTIKNQTIRGAVLIRNLNAFAHSPDYEEKEIDIVATSRMLSALIERKCKSSEVSIHTESSPLPAMIRTQPVRFEMALLAAIEIVMGWTKKGGRLTIVPEMKETGAFIKISGHEVSNEKGEASCVGEDLLNDQLRLLEDIMKTIKGRAERPSHGKEIILSFNV